jgi:hypothetical protein
MQKLKIFDKYGQASCRFMCQKILASLPPELCDMIIERFIEHNPAGVIARGICEPIYTHSNQESMEHYWTVEYVGKPMLARMMAVWYRTNSFIMLWRLPDMRQFLNEDAPCINLPRCKLITKMSITVSPDLLAFDFRKNVLGPYHDDPPRTWENQIRDLNLLFQLRRGASIHILLDCPDPNEVSKGQNAVFLRDIDPMTGILCRLRNSGYVLGASVLIRGDYHGLLDYPEYRLEKVDAEKEEETDIVLLNETCMVWRSVLTLYIAFDSRLTCSADHQSGRLSTCSVRCWNLRASSTFVPWYRGGTSPTSDSQLLQFIP